MRTAHCLQLYDVNLLQGLVLDCSPLDWEALERLPPADSFPPGAPPVWVALDEVQDPVSHSL
jgi:tRNA G18 (ribose-2'-O)-methylase SpoU